MNNRYNTKYKLLFCKHCGVFIFKIKFFKYVACVKCKKLIQKKCRKEWSLKNKDKILNYESTKIGSKIRNKRYRLKNRNVILKRKKEWYIKKKSSDKFYKVQVALRKQVYILLKTNGRSKTKKTQEYLGCTYEFFKEYIQSKFVDGMSWDNYGINGWHIDHIIPCSSFDFSKEDDIKICFNYKNLQPLWWFDNLEKSNKREIKYKNI